MSKTTYIILGVILVLCVIPLGICAAYQVFQAGQLQDKWQGFNQSCDGQPVAASTKYSEGAGLHPIAYFHKTSGWELGTFGFFTTNAPWLPEDTQKAELVACFTEETVTVETCEYDNGAKKVFRTRIDVDLTLREAQTGKVVAEKSFKGTPGEKCSDSQLFKKGTTKITLSGDYPPKSEVDNWLKQYVNP